MTSLFTCVFPYKMQNLGGPSVMKKKTKKQQHKNLQQIRNAGTAPSLLCVGLAGSLQLLGPSWTPNLLLMYSGEPQIPSWISQGNPKSWSVQILMLFSVEPTSPLGFSASEEPVPTHVYHTATHHSVSTQNYRLFVFISKCPHPSTTEGTTLSGPSTTSHLFLRFKWQGKTYYSQN